MTIHWILIMVLWSHAGTFAIKAEFDNEAACRNAIEQIDHTTIRGEVQTICVPRFK